MSERNEQLDRHREALEAKQEEERAHAEEHSLESSATTQDVTSPRQKGTQHKKKTADKWNQ
jgi:hypothetical protein